MRIVIIEDEVKTRKGIIRQIGKIDPGYQVVGEAGNGVEGVKLIAETKPDLVIADITMPEFNGLEMLERVKKAGIRHKTIIISGYSDFKFAQQAIKIGVFEYLLKPITVERLANSLDAIAEEINKEKQLQKSQLAPFSSAESVLQDIMLGNTHNIAAATNYLKERYGIDPDRNFIVLTVYLGQNYPALQEQLPQILVSALDHYHSGKYFLLHHEAQNQLVLLFCQDFDPDYLERFFQNVLIPNMKSMQLGNLVFGMIPFSGLSNFRKQLATLANDLKWSISLGDDVLIVPARVPEIRTERFSYPMDIEKNVKTAVYSLDNDKTYEIAEKFILYCRQQPYQPIQIIEALVRFTSSIINVIKEVHYELYNQINQKEILQKIMESCTRDELTTAFVSFIQKITSYGVKEQKAVSPVIKKALNLISEHYPSITLVEMASSLHVTPEYVSAVFNKELGVNFSVYLKEYKINKAKELLVNSNLKAYEIAEKLGYQDHKYFYRIFKELSGFSPVEYQKVYKK